MKVINTKPLCIPRRFRLADSHPKGRMGTGCLLQLQKPYQACPAGLRRSGGIKEISCMMIGPSLSAKRCSFSLAKIRTPRRNYGCPPYTGPKSSPIPDMTCHVTPSMQSLCLQQEA